MINWNITDARKVERLSDINRIDDERTVVKVTSAAAEAKSNPTEDEKNVRAIALLAAIILTAILAIWRDPESLLWLFLAGLAASSWCCALATFISEILKAAIAWLVEAFAYLRDLLANWRDGARRFIDRWVWTRFRANHARGDDHVATN